MGITPGAVILIGYQAWGEIFMWHHAWGRNLYRASHIGRNFLWGITPGAEIFVGHHAWGGNLWGIMSGVEIFKGHHAWGEYSWA